MPVASPQAIETLKALIANAESKNETEVVLKLAADGRLPCNVRKVPVFSRVTAGKSPVFGVLLDQKPGMLITSVLLEDLKAWFPGSDSDQGPEDEGPMTA